jgi:hypothetical protein
VFCIEAVIAAASCSSHVLIPNATEMFEHQPTGRGKSSDLARSREGYAPALPPPANFVLAI